MGEFFTDAGCDTDCISSFIVSSAKLIGSRTVGSDEKEAGLNFSIDGWSISMYNRGDDGCGSIKLADSRLSDALDSIFLTRRRLAAMAISGVSSTTGPATLGECASGGGDIMLLDKSLDGMQFFVEV